MPAARLPQRVDRRNAAAAQLDAEAVVVERAVREVPGRLRAGAADAVHAERRVHLRRRLAQPHAAERRARDEGARTRERGGGRRRGDESGKRRADECAPHGRWSMAAAGSGFSRDAKRGNRSPSLGRSTICEEGDDESLPSLGRPRAGIAGGRCRSCPRDSRRNGGERSLGMPRPRPDLDCGRRVRVDDARRPVARPRVERGLHSAADAAGALPDGGRVPPAQRGLLHRDRLAAARAEDAREPVGVRRLLRLDPAARGGQDQAPKRRGGEDPRARPADARRRGGERHRLDDLGERRATAPGTTPASRCATG